MGLKLLAAAAAPIRLPAAGYSMLDFAVAFILVVMARILANTAQNFIRAVSGRTVEVCNYSVVAQGLPPDATHSQVGAADASQQLGSRTMLQQLAAA